MAFASDLCADSSAYNDQRCFDPASAPLVAQLSNPPFSSHSWGREALSPIVARAPHSRDRGLAPLVAGTGSARAAAAALFE